MFCRFNFQDEITSSPTVLFHGSLLDFDFFKVFRLSRSALSNPYSDFYEFFFLVEDKKGSRIFKYPISVPAVFEFQLFSHYFSVLTFLDGLDVSYILTVSVSKPNFLSSLPSGGEF